MGGKNALSLSLWLVVCLCMWIIHFTVSIHTHTHIQKRKRKKKRRKKAYLYVSLLPTPLFIRLLFCRHALPIPSLLFSSCLPVFEPWITRSVPTPKGKRLRIRTVDHLGYANSRGKTTKDSNRGPPGLCQLPREND